MAEKQKNKRIPDPQLKKEMAWKNNLFARYILLRYSLALFFFSNLYWAMILVYHSSPVIVVPLLAIILIVLGSAEQLRLYGKKEAILTWTKRAFQFQTITNFLALALIFIPNQFSTVFPIFSDNLTGKIFVIILQGLGLAVVLLNLRKVGRIERKTDRFYLRFQQTFGKSI
ncbi:PTS transporter [Streptococcus criceti]|uniref:Uncharacterized protein n=1 Tax=Streptococcus criceti HS-6 TaxID=873449 RepID=G5JNB3_STRCG|nr:hypothetical protein [Streptococcus criceti]EHI74904.1 hypothetical protein STRCR_0150 [Streptococcus criceti HS-6]SUN41662.1 PTS transporter [Streptococcus criceti]